MRDDACAPTDDAVALWMLGAAALTASERTSPACWHSALRTPRTAGCHGPSCGGGLASHAWSSVLGAAALAYLILGAVLMYALVL